MTPTHARALAHESGHALVAWFSPNCESVAEVIAREDGSGIVASHWPPEKPVRVLWERTSQILGGIAGEYCALGSYRAGGAADDLMKAINVARRIVLLQGADTVPWQGDAYAEKLTHVERAFANGITDDEALVLNRSLRHAIHMIERQRTGFDALQAHLATQRLVYGHELEAHFGNRKLIRLFSIFR